MVSRRAPASMAFSTSSLTTDAGRSTTSPAAIWFARSGGRRLILPIALRSDPAPAAEIQEHAGNHRDHRVDDAMEQRHRPFRENLRVARRVIAQLGDGAGVA